MRAIILAAGKGERLYPLTRNTPKSLLDIGNGISLIENQLVSLEQAGINDVVIVVGYRADQIEAKINSFCENNCRVNTVYNPFFDISNNLISLWTAINYMNDDFLIINGDDIFQPQIIRELKKISYDKEICMTVSRKNSYEFDDMKVITKDDKVLRVSKEISSDEANGESIGIIRVVGKSKKIFTKYLAGAVRDCRNRDKFYLEIFQKIMDDGWPVYFFEVDAKSWAEVDFHPDLQFVRSNVDAFTKMWKFSLKE